MSVAPCSADATWTASGYGKDRQYRHQQTMQAAKKNTADHGAAYMS